MLVVYLYPVLQDTCAASFLLMRARIYRFATDHSTANSLVGACTSVVYPVSFTRRERPRGLLRCKVSGRHRWLTRFCSSAYLRRPPGRDFVFSLVRQIFSHLLASLPGRRCPVGGVFVRGADRMVIKLSLCWGSC